MAQLGDHTQYIDSRTTQIAHGDTGKEIGEIIGRYCNGIAIRQVDWGIGNAYLTGVAEHSRVPVLSMQDDFYHPFQGLADMLTIFERFGGWSDDSERGSPIYGRRSLCTREYAA